MIIWARVLYSFSQSALLIEFMCPHIEYDGQGHVLYSYDSDTTISHMNPRSRVMIISFIVY